MATIPFTFLMRSGVAVAATMTLPLPVDQPSSMQGPILSISASSSAWSLAFALSSWKAWLYLFEIILHVV